MMQTNHEEALRGRLQSEAHTSPRRHDGRWAVLWAAARFFILALALSSVVACVTPGAIDPANDVADWKWPTAQELIDYRASIPRHFPYLEQGPLGVARRGTSTSFVRSEQSGSQSVRAMELKWDDLQAALKLGHVSLNMNQPWTGDGLNEPPYGEAIVSDIRSATHGQSGILIEWSARYRVIGRRYIREFDLDYDIAMVEVEPINKDDADYVLGLVVVNPHSLAWTEESRLQPLPMRGEVALAFLFQRDGQVVQLAPKSTWDATVHTPWPSSPPPGTRASDFGSDVWQSNFSGSYRDRPRLFAESWRYTDSARVRQSVGSQGRPAAQDWSLVEVWRYTNAFHPLGNYLERCQRIARNYGIEAEPLDLGQRSKERESQLQSR